MVRNDRGAIQKQHQTKWCDKKEHGLAQHDRGAIQKQRKTKANWYDKMNFFGTRRSKRNLKNTKNVFVLVQSQKQSVQSQQKSTPNLGKTEKSDFE